MNELFSERAKAALMIAQNEAKAYRHHSIGSEHLLLGLIEEQEGIAGKVLRELSLTPQEVRDELEQFITLGEGKKLPTKAILPYSYKARKVIQYAADEARKFHQTVVGTEHILLGLLRDETLLSSKLLENLNVNLSSVRQLVLKKLGISEPRSNGQKMNAGRRPKQPGAANAKKIPEGTPTLDSLARDLTKMAAQGELDPIVGRDLEIRRITQILSRRTKNNPVLVGEAGVGKTAIVEGLAQKIVKNQVPPILQNKRLMTLDMGSLVAGTKYRGEFEDRMKRIINEIYHDKNVILFIDELHTLIGAGSAEGAIDASNLIKPALARGELQTIGATTLDEYQKHIEKDPALERRFASVRVKQPNDEDTLEILKGLNSRYEDHHGVTISEEAQEQAVKLSMRYITDRQLPDKAIDLIDEAAAKVQIDQSTNETSLTEASEKLKELYKQKDELIQNQQFEEAAKIR
ncbi:MAG TPA: ATP-dependent Clp protease ATP-binding subunit, partial [Alloiococcus sp.]|nr:ATP-dependent Clp protease ATP-binding subunit [Alloiococcus sp.]